MRYREARGILRGVLDGTMNVDPSTLAEACRLLGAQVVEPEPTYSPETAVEAARIVFRETLRTGHVPEKVTITPT